MDAKLRRDVLNCINGRDQLFMGSVAGRSVEDQLRQLRQNPAARTELSRRVEDYRHQKSGLEDDAEDKVKLNATQLAVRSSPDAIKARRKELAREEQQRFERSKANRAVLDKDLAEWREATVNRDSFMRVKRAKDAKEAAAASATRARCELASILVFGAARMQVLADAVLEARARRKRDASMLVGAVVVQKLWRALVARRRYLRIRKAVLTVQRFTRNVIWARRYERRQKAAELVMAFMTELDRSSAFLRAVKELQHRIDMEKRHLVNLAACRRAHLDCVLRQWQKAETAALDEAKKAAPPKTNFKPQPEDKKKQTAKKAAAPTSQQLMEAQPKPADAIILPHFVAVPEQVKSTIINAYLAAKRDAFIQCGVARWKAVVPYVKWWRPQHDVETARSLVDASFPGFTPFQPPAGVRFRPRAAEPELKAMMQHGVQSVLISRLQHQEGEAAKERAKLEEQLAQKQAAAAGQAPDASAPEAAAEPAATDSAQQVQQPAATSAPKQQLAFESSTPEDASAYLARAIRAQCPVSEQSEEEKRQILQERLSLMKRFGALDIKLEDGIRSKA